MDLYHTTDTDGVTELNPSAEIMRELLDSLDNTGAGEAEHPDVSLVHDTSGWSISVFPSGVVTFENLDEPDEMPRYMIKVSRNEALKFWIDLSHGRIEHLRSQPWLREEA
ncbi:MAG: hypothetical protein GVY36_10340 [Verrucomicrobia bacterium]|jgi:hypothetical protein|nr:hypothetical protein [Verrucomicrobiota bacterium]